MRYNKFLKHFFLFSFFFVSVIAFARTSKDTIEVFDDRALDSILKLPESKDTAAVIPIPAPTKPSTPPAPTKPTRPETPEGIEFFFDDTYKEKLDGIRDVEDDYVEDTTSKIDSLKLIEEQYFIESAEATRLDNIVDHDTVVEVAKYEEHITYDAVIPFPFTVNDGGQQVFFSSGNLQYQASTKTWRFAREQYHFVGGEGSGNVPNDVLGGGIMSKNNSIGRTYNGWIDLFGWGTSGWNSGARCYMPYSHDNNDSYYQIGKEYTNDFADEEYDRADWGIYNIIDGYAPGTWHTLLSNEWDFLIKKRKNAKYLFGFGTIEGVNGMFLLPDTWDLKQVETDADVVVDPVEKPDLGENMSAQEMIEMAQEENEEAQTPTGITPIDTLAPPPPVGLFIPGSNGHNVYSAAQWRGMQAQGAVFLPAAGQRTAVIVTYINRVGMYWSGSINLDIREQVDCLYFVKSKTAYFKTKDPKSRSEGFSVRLVKYADDKHHSK